MQMTIGQSKLPEPARLAILTASEAEAAYIRPCLDRKVKLTQTPGTLWYGRCRTQEVVLLRCGIGPTRAIVGLRWLLGHVPIWGVLNVGFAGGLQPKLATGDAVWATHIDTVGRTRVGRDPDLMPDRALTALVAEAANRAGLVRHCGGLLSSSELIARATAKCQLGEQSGALAVDMESYGLRCESARLDLPFVSMRTIFDTCHDDLLLPVDICTVPDGRLRYGHLAAYLAWHPRTLLALPRLAHKARLAGRHLGTWLDHFFAILDESSTCFQPRACGFSLRLWNAEIKHEENEP